MINPFDSFLVWINSITDNIWIAAIATGVVIIVLTCIMSAIVSVIIRRILTRESMPLPSMSIYVNLGRIVV